MLALQENKKVKERLPNTVYTNPPVKKRSCLIKKYCNAKIIDRKASRADGLKEFFWKI
jgi:hypothetical protein